MVRIPTFLLRDRITISNYLGSGARGDVWGTPRTVRAQVEPTNRLVIDTAGQQARAEANAYIRPEDGPVPVESKVVWGGKTFRVLAAGAIPDEVRPSHRELTLG